MTYYLIRAHHKNGVSVIVRTVADTLSGAYDMIKILHGHDADHGDANDWWYTVEGVVKVAEYQEEQA